jgi:hypothetical protein
MQLKLKMFVLSGAAVALWLVPLTALDKRIGWHKSMQGVTLCAAIACAVTAGNIAREQAEQNEIEEIKAHAITADVVDEIATSAYISQQQRQQEAELILASPSADVEQSRKVLEAIYGNDLQDLPSTSVPETDSDVALWWKVSAAEVEGKSPTWIIENILNMKGRKFTEGKARLAELQRKFGEG